MTQFEEQKPIDPCFHEYILAWTSTNKPVWMIVNLSHQKEFHKHATLLYLTCTSSFNLLCNGDSSLTAKMSRYVDVSSFLFRSHTFRCLCPTVQMQCTVHPPPPHAAVAGDCGSWGLFCNVVFNCTSLSNVAHLRHRGSSHDNIT